jgi:hypothetical protein
MDPIYAFVIVICIAGTGLFALLLLGVYEARQQPIDAPVLMPRGWTEAYEANRQRRARPPHRTLPAHPPPTYDPVSPPDYEA